MDAWRFQHRVPFGCWLSIAGVVGGAVGGGLIVLRTYWDVNPGDGECGLAWIGIMAVLVVGVPVGFLFGSLSAMLLALFLKWAAERGDEGGF